MVAKVSSLIIPHWSGHCATFIPNSSGRQQDLPSKTVPPYTTGAASKIDANFQKRSEKNCAQERCISITSQYFLTIYPQLSKWYTITREDVIKHGGKKLFRYYSSMEQMLRSLYPEYPWDSSKFVGHLNKGPSGVTLALIEKISNELGIQQVRRDYLLVILNGFNSLQIGIRHQRVKLLPLEGDPCSLTTTCWRVPLWPLIQTSHGTQPNSHSTNLPWRAEMTRIDTVAHLKTQLRSQASRRSVSLIFISCKITFLTPNKAFGLVFSVT